MDTSGIANDSLLGANMVKAALKMQAQNTATLLDSIPKPQQSMASEPAPASPDPASRLGQHIDVKA